MIALAIECVLQTIGIGCIKLMLAEILISLRAFLNMHKSFLRDEINRVIPTSNDAYQSNSVSIIVLNGKFKYSLRILNPLVMLLGWPLS